MPQQRLRLTYRVHGPAVDAQRGWVSRAWVDAFATAGVPLGRRDSSRRPRIEIGPSLPPGASGERELLDAWLAEPVEAETVACRLAPAAPPGLEPVEAVDVGEYLPSLSTSIRSARYRVTFEPSAVVLGVLRERIDALLELRSLDWVEQRGERLRSIDLRAAVLDLDLACAADCVTIEMHLELTQERTGRPVSVLAALGVEARPASVVRTALEVEYPRVALRAWRERGRFE
jgi:radical SAM-linked protein